MTGGTGSRQSAFRYMLRLLGVGTELAVVKDGRLLGVITASRLLGAALKP